MVSIEINKCKEKPKRGLGLIEVEDITRILRAYYQKEILPYFLTPEELRDKTRIDMCSDSLGERARNTSMINGAFGLPDSLRSSKTYERLTRWVRDGTKIVQRVPCEQYAKETVDRWGCTERTEENPIASHWLVSLEDILATICIGARTTKDGGNSHDGLFLNFASWPTLKDDQILKQKLGKRALENMEEGFVGLFEGANGGQEFADRYIDAATRLGNALHRCGSPRKDRIYACVERSGHGLLTKDKIRMLVEYRYITLENEKLIRDVMCFGEEYTKSVLGWIGDVKNGKMRKAEELGWEQKIPPLLEHIGLIPDEVQSDGELPAMAIYKALMSGITGNERAYCNPDSIMKKIKPISRWLNSMPPTTRDVLTKKIAELVYDEDSIDGITDYINEMPKDTSPEEWIDGYGKVEDACSDFRLKIDGIADDDIFSKHIMVSGAAVAGYKEDIVKMAKAAGKNFEQLGRKISRHLLDTFGSAVGRTVEKYGDGAAALFANMPHYWDVLDKADIDFIRELHEVTGLEVPEAYVMAHQVTPTFGVEYKKLLIKVADGAGLTAGEAFKALGKLPEEILKNHQATLVRLAELCGWRTPQAYNILPENAVINNDKELRNIMEVYGKHVWGLFAAFGNDILKKEHRHREELTEMMHRTNDGAGMAIATAPLPTTGLLWKMLDKYEEGSGYIFAMCQSGKKTSTNDLMRFEERWGALTSRARQELGIRNAARYMEKIRPHKIDAGVIEESLRSLSSEYKKDKPLAVVMVSRFDCFDVFTTAPAATCKRLEKDYKVLLYEVLTPEQAGEAVRRAGALHGKREDGSPRIPVRDLVIDVHGAPHYAQLGYETTRRMKITDKDGHVFKAWSPNIARGGNVIWGACYAGSDGIFGNNLVTATKEHIPHANVHGMQVPGSLVDFEMVDGLIKRPIYKYGEKTTLRI